METPSDAPDFVILGEFSEIEGPISRKVLPQGVDLMFDGQPFDVEGFVLRIMSVELNTNNDDWTTTLELPEHGFYAFVQHISLLDLNARGYVRPIAIAFISKSQGKIFNNFHIFHGYMSEISNMLKVENHRIFSSDLQKRLADLRLTESTLLQAKSSPKSHGISPTPHTLREHIDDLCVLQNRLLQHEHVEIIQPPQSSAEAELLQGVPPSVLATLPEQVEHYQPKILSSLHRNSSLYSKELRNLDVLCGKNWDCAMNELELMLSTLNMPDIVIYLHEQDLSAVQNNVSLLQLDSPFNQAAWESFPFGCEDQSEIDPQEHASHLSHFVGANHSTPQTISAPPRPTPTLSVSAVSGPNTASGSFESPSPREIGVPFPMEANSPDGVVVHIEPPKNDTKAKLATPGKKKKRISSSDTTDNTTSSNRGSAKKTPPPKQQISPPMLDPRCLEPSPIQGLETFAQTLWSCSKASAGVGLLDFLQIGNSWSPHLIFSLLKGRPVIIYAEKENEATVRRVVQALSIFVALQSAGNTCDELTEQAVIYWWPSEEPLTFTALGKIKLAGFSKEKQISLAIQKYATILDVESRTLRGPYYKGGGFIRQVLEEKDWPSESAFIAHVHSLIYDWSMKACLFYHFCCIGIPTEEPAIEAGEKSDSVGATYPRIARSQSLSSFDHDPRKLGAPRSAANTWSSISLGDAEKEKKREKQLFRDSQKEKYEQFFKSWDVRESDREIVEYLANVVITQQVWATNSLLPPSQQTLPSYTIHLDYNQTYLFEHKK